MSESVDQDGFVEFLKAANKSQSTIRGFVRRARSFENYLSNNTDCISIENLSEKILIDYIHWGNKSEINVYQQMWAIASYYRFLGKLDLAFLCKEYEAKISIEKMRLREFQDVDAKFIEILKSHKIVRVSQFLEVVNSTDDYKNLAKKTGIQEEYIIELMKLSNLTRLPGLKAKRARLYHDAGVDSLKKLAKWKPDELREMLLIFVKDSGYKGVAPTLSEATTAVKHAKYQVEKYPDEYFIG
ncbi:MAG: DUF4332 domain-containing protein [Candidatus Kariarchaeaceae archaeon]|jgi:hypothetical protein